MAQFWFVVRHSIDGGGRLSALTEVPYFLVGMATYIGLYNLYHFVAAREKLTELWFSLVCLCNASHQSDLAMI